MTTHVSDALNEKQASRESNRLAKCYSLGVMDTVEDIRRMNLRALVEQKGSVRAVAELLGKSSAQISQWLNASPDSKTGKPRNISAVSAREIEKKLGMPRGLFDQPITGTSPQRAVETAEQRINPLTIIRRLDGQVTPRSKATLLRLEKLAIEGSLTDEEWSLLEGIVDRFERAHRA